MELSRDKAFALLSEYTKSESLIKHALSVEAAMDWYAKYFKVSEEERLKWKITGLLHDFDYEVAPHITPPDGHVFLGNKILTDLGYPEDIKEAIMGHANYSGVARTSLMAKTLYAVDELSGFITACTLVRPDKALNSVKVSSVKKKLKSKGFAQGCNRDDIREGAEEINIELDQHIENVILALCEISDELGL